MFKKLLMVVATLIATMGFAFADVDVNKADQTALDGIKGIGPAKSKAILAERTKGGNFKDWTDFEQRVKGIGEKNAAKLSAAGLTVNGQAKPNAPAAPAKATPAAASASAAPAMKADKIVEKAADKATKAAASASASAMASAPAAPAKAAAASKAASTK